MVDTTMSPLHDLLDVKRLIEADAWDYATRRCQQDVASLDLRRDQVRELLMLLEPGNFRKVFGPCQTDFGTRNADDYVLWCNLTTLQRCRREQGDRLYIKLCVDTHPEDGDACLLISFHLSGR